MSVLSFLWKPKEIYECSLHGLNFFDNKIVILLRENVSNDGVLKKFVLMKRSSNEELRFGLNREGGALKVEINMDAHKLELSDGIWDAYIELDKKRQRVRNDLTDIMDVSSYYIEETDHVFTAYSTIKGNLSFKAMVSSAKLVTDQILLNELGYLTIGGYFLVPSWGNVDTNQLKKYILLKANNEEKEIKISSVDRKDITDKFGQSKLNYDWSGFRCELDFLNKDYGIPFDKSLKLFIKFVYKNKEMELPIQVPQSISFNNTSLIKTGNGIINILLNQNAGNLNLYSTRAEISTEIDEIYMENNQIKLNGRVITKKMEDILPNTKKISILFINRDSGYSFENNCMIDGQNFTGVIMLTDLMKREWFTDGIWDLYLKSGYKKFRLVSRADGIPNKQKVVSIPQQLLPNINGEAKVIKAYYTLHDEVSLLVRDYLAVKKIETVDLNQNTLLIEGKLNIQTPNEEVANEVNGEITIKGTYGETYVLPTKWSLEKTNKTKLEFNFKAKVNVEKVKDLTKLLSEIDFDLIQCNIELANVTAIFSMIIDPAKVLVTKEDRLKQSPKQRQRISSIGPALYSVFNKVLPIKKRVIVFQSFHGKSYTDSPKAIYERLLAEGYKMEPVWVLNNLKQDILGNPIIVRPLSLKYYYYMAIGKYFVNNGNFPNFYKKREGTVHLQTWHGTPLKKLGFDIDPNSPSYAENTSPDLLRRNARWDYLIGPNDYTSKILQRAFRFNKSMLDVGYPRNDIFYQNGMGEKAKKIKEKLAIPSDKKVILYAPTWRDYEFHNGQANNPYSFKFDLNTFKEKFGQEYVLLLRLHYRDASRIKLHNEYEDFVYNVSSYNDIQELYLISNILITDYSSVMFDFANLNRPMIFFTYDLSRYGSQIRGFYFDFKKEAPGPIVLNDTRLFLEIDNLDHLNKRYAEKYEKFREKFCHLEDGNASKRVIDSVFNELG